MGESLSTVAVLMPLKFERSTSVAWGGDSRLEHADVKGSRLGQLGLMKLSVTVDALQDARPRGQFGD